MFNIKKYIGYVIYKKLCNNKLYEPHQLKARVSVKKENLKSLQLKDNSIDRLGVFVFTHKLKRDFLFKRSLSVSSLFNNQFSVCVCVGGLGYVCCLLFFFCLWREFRFWREIKVTDFQCLLIKNNTRICMSSTTIGVCCVCVVE
jgi:hypothetical protein